MTILGICIDKRVLIGLAALGVGIWIAYPGLLAGALPFLLFLLCPLSMLLMMRGGSHGGHDMGGHQMAASGDRLADLERERARIDAEIARTRVSGSERRIG